MTLCPRCHRSERFGVYLSPIKTAIVDAIVRAAHVGISANDLLGIVWGDDPPGREAVKSHIKQINDVLAHTDIRIRSAGRQPALYYLARERAVA